MCLWWKNVCTSSNPKYTCKKCRRKISTEDIEDIFKEQLKKFLLSEKDIEAYFESSQKGIKEKGTYTCSRKDRKIKIKY